MTPLMAAARKGQRDVVKVLLANGADVTAVSVEVYTVCIYHYIHCTCTYMKQNGKIIW